MAENIESNQSKDVNDSKKLKNTNFDLTKFRLEKILNNNSQSKSICIFGQFLSENPSNHRNAIILFEKIAFTEENVKTENAENLNCASFFTSTTELKEVFINDIYGNFKCIPNAELNSKLFIFLKITFFLSFCIEFVRRFSFVFVFFLVHYFIFRCKNNYYLSMYRETH